MTSWIPFSLPSSIQKRFLSYALSKTGLFDDSAIDLDKWNFTWGRKNVVELKDVALSTLGITEKLKLPSCLQIESARILFLRIMIPADIHRSSIECEVDGIEISVSYRDVEKAEEQGTVVQAQSESQAPSHRKIHRRIKTQSVKGKLADEAIPSVQDLAKSFLLDEPVVERQQLEASVAAQTASLEESVVSDTSDGADIGTGAALGVPAFLAGFLHGILDRLMISIKNVKVTVQIETPVKQLAAPLQFQFSIGSGRFWSTTETAQLNPATKPTRHVEIKDIAFDFLSQDDNSSESPLQTSKLSSSLAQSQTTEQDLQWRPSLAADVDLSSSNLPSVSSVFASQSTLHRSAVSKSVEDADRFADAHEEDAAKSEQGSELDIQPGEDNISWAVRRNKSGVGSQELWDSVASDEDLPDSLLFDVQQDIRQSRIATRPQFATQTSSTNASSKPQLGQYGQYSQYSQRSHQTHDRLTTKHGPSPGSWPVHDQSQSMISQESDDRPVALAQSTKNSQPALDESVHSNSDHQSVIEESLHYSSDDLAQSRFFTHDEAKSMYMSAMAQESETSSVETRLNMPGTWQSELNDSPKPTTHHEHLTSIIDQQPIHLVTVSKHDLITSASRPGSGAETPKAQQATSQNDFEPAAEAFKRTRLLSVDTVSLHLPIFNNSAEEKSGTTTACQNDHLPGSFPSHAKSTLVRDISSLSSADSHSSEKSQSASTITDHAERLLVEIGIVTLQSDIPTAQTMLQIGKMLQSTLIDSTKSDSKTESGNETKENPALYVAISQINLQLVMKTSSRKQTNAEELRPLLSLQLTSISIDVDRAETCIKTDMAMMVGEKRLLSFDRKSKSQSRDTHAGSDLQITYVHGKTDVKDRPVQELLVDAQLLTIDLDLTTIDATFSGFGGLSGLIELGESAFSESDGTRKKTTGVRFQDEPVTEASSSLKVNARLVGISALLQGQTSAMFLHTSSLKAVYREQAISAVISAAHVEAPYFPEPKDCNRLSLYNLRLDFLLRPVDKDLEKLIALLTPSKDKYEDDDDILIDTLLRQRKKGSCLRITAEEMSAKISSWDDLMQLQSLSSELSQAAEVTKYLPEDDRPGLLIMFRIWSIHGRLPTNEKLGDVNISLKDFQIAHVGLPSLLAASLSDLNLATSDENHQLIHCLQPLSGPDNLPMIMVRMVGGEAEPTVKLKIFNTCAEYSVAALLKVIGEPNNVEIERIVEDVAASVADLAFSQTVSTILRKDQPSESASDKQTKVDVLIHHSAIGLTPQNLPSKALLIFTDAKTSMHLPPSTQIKIATKLRRAALFLTERTTDQEETNAVPRRTSENTATDLDLANALIQRGYVSIASIMSTNIDVSISEKEHGLKATEVEVGNELMLLETCADSTQTLIATLNGLAPPAPPAKQPKYLTEPISLEEMMSSFVGETVEQAEITNDMLFDVDNISDEHSNIDALSAAMEESNINELLAQSEISESVYGPISGLLGDDFEQSEIVGDEEDRPLTEAAESLLEEDPFVMTVTPDDMPFSDNALLKDLRQQAKIVVDVEAVDIGEIEFEDLGFDALGPDVQVLGQKHRFCAPINQQRQRKDKPDHFPFKLRLCNSNLLWNIHEGYDWQHTRDGITSAVEKVEAQAEERLARRRHSRNEFEDDESVIGDCLFNSIYIGVPSAQEAQDIRRQINRHIDDLASETESVPLSGISRPSAYSTSGRPHTPRARRRLKLERSRSHKVAFEIKGASADVFVYPPDSKEIQSAVDIRVKSFEIFDNVPTSTWKKFLTRLKKDGETTEISQPMMHIELLNVKTIQDFSASELVLHVSILPLRLHVDQDALDFITRFFEFNDDSIPKPSEASEQPFLQRVEIDTVDLQLDYKPKKIDYAGLRSGHTTEFMNFVILDAANIKLRHAIVYGIKGFEPLHKTLNDVWMPDVRRNQLPTVLAGLAPVRSLANITTGVRDVVAIPVREYRKDGRIFRSVQKGAYQFGKTTASEMARLGAKLAIGTQNALSNAEGFLSPATTSSPTGRPVVSQRVSAEHGWHDIESYDDGEREQRAISAYADQPLGILSGLRSARRFLEHDLLTAKDALIAVQGEIMNSEGPGSAAAAVARHAPTVILRPVIGATRAVGTALLGVGNQIDSDNMRRMQDKYKRR